MWISASKKEKGRARDGEEEREVGEREGEREGERSEREKGGSESRKLERWLLKQIERKTDRHTRVVEEARVTPRRQ